MAEDQEKLDKIKKLLDRIKKIAENLIDECPREYDGEAQLLYSTASGFIQKIDLDLEDKIKEAEEESKY